MISNGIILADIMAEIDYSKALLSFIGTRKHFFSDVKYFCYIFPDYLIMGAKQHDRKPKYIIQITLETSIGWKVEQKEKNKLILLSFSFLYKNKHKEMSADSNELWKMKSLLKNSVSFSKIADFYEPQYILGKGSSARVLQIKDLITEKKFAAKSIDKAYLEKSENGLQAFHSEVRILKHLSKQNRENQHYFLNLYDIFEGDFTYYLIIELMRGKTLQEELDLLKVTLHTLFNYLKMRKEKFPFAIVKYIMRQLLEGVEIMHQNGIIHRDIKPDNIMFVEQNNFQTLTIVDFGLATETNVSKYMFPKCGTPGYVAPEILNLQDRTMKYSEVCDVFSCGCIFYKLLTGNSLFSGKEFNEVLKINKACEIDLYNISLNELSEDSLNLLKGMLEKDPRKRMTASQALQSSFFDKAKLYIPLEQVNDAPITIKQNQQPTSDPLMEPSHNIFKPQIKIINVEIQDDEEGFSPFQRGAKNIQQEYKFDECDEVKNEEGQIDGKIQQKQDDTSQVSDQEVMQEFNDKTHMKILNLPNFKKPGFKVQESNKDVSPTLVHKNFRGSIIGSFYSKEPLSGTKKHRKNNTIMQQQQVQNQEQQVGQMKRISLFYKDQQQS